MRMKYGFLLQNFTASNTLPVFRTESQDRMLASALNFAIGFFGYPFDGQYQQSITIEENGFNNTLAPYKTCPNAGDRTKSDRAIPYVQQWAGIYLKDALARLRPQMHGYELTIEDVYTLQQTCAYEVRSRICIEQVIMLTLTKTVAIGYSKFCELFTEDEWKGFNYAYASKLLSSHCLQRADSNAPQDGPILLVRLRVRLTGGARARHWLRSGTRRAAHAHAHPRPQLVYERDAR